MHPRAPLAFEPPADAAERATMENAAGAVRRAYRPLAPYIADAIERQNAAYAPSAQRDAHLRELRSGAAAVVTGQQVGLFLGPIFNIYKVSTAIVAARALRTSTNLPVVPVFWLQSEDHDIVEIAHHHTLSATTVPLSLQLPADREDRRSLAHHTLPPCVTQRLVDLREALASLPFADEHVDRLVAHYVPGRRWVDAFAGMLAELFAADGLVLVDGRDEAFAAAHRAVHDRAVRESDAIAAALIEHAAQRHDRGDTVPVHVRPGAPLSFFHPEGPDGPRHRLVPADGGWRALGTDGRWTTAELLARLHDSPLCFSTSALLRPVLQDIILPTAVYVGGATEVAYWAQIPPLYAAFDLPMPAVLERASFRIIGDRCTRLLERWQLEACDCEGSLESILRRAAPPSVDAVPLSNEILDPALDALARTAPRLVALDPDLQIAVDKTRDAIATSVAKLAARYERACFRRNERLVADAGTLSAVLFPDGQPQERFYGLSGFAARYGDRRFIESITAAVRPFEPLRRDVRCHRGAEKRP